MNKMKSPSPAEEDSPRRDPPVSIGNKVSKLINNMKETNGLRRFTRKKENEVKDLNEQIDKRKWEFGDQYLRLAESGASRKEMDQCLKRAQDDVKEIQMEVRQKKDEIENKTAEVEARIQAYSTAADADALAKEQKKKEKKAAKDTVFKSPIGRRKRKSKPPRKSKAPDTAADAAADIAVEMEEDDEDVTEADEAAAAAVETAGGPSGEAEDVQKTQTGEKELSQWRLIVAEDDAEPPEAAAAKYPPKSESKPPAKWKNTFAKQTRTDEPDPKRWKCVESRFGGKAKFRERGIQQKWEGTVSQSIKKFRRAPGKYVALMYQSDMPDWDEDEQESNVVYREGTVGWKPEGVSKDGWMTVLVHHYERCRPFPNDQLPKEFRDAFTDSMTFEGAKVHSKRNPPIMPGRLMGWGDAPSLKIVGDIGPSDVFQGSVGDCWLLSGISALAEFDGAIKKLFRKTTDLLNMPTDEPNLYVVTLWDLETFEEVDVVIDERLCAHPSGEGELLGAKPSKDGELWVPYLEKAVATHCGGFDKIVGGQCTHAWALLTGCKEQYTITKCNGKGEYGCYGRYIAAENRWAKHGNSPHDGEQGSWLVPWPEVGGGGDGPISRDALFKKMVAWDRANYIVGAGTKEDGNSDAGGAGGMVDNHAYSVIASLEDVAGTGVDLLKLRNPWGRGEIEDGRFEDGGPGWDEYPQIRELIKPVVADDGIFWVTKDEFFAFFGTIYVSASDMTAFLEDTDHQYG